MGLFLENNYLDALSLLCICATLLYYYWTSNNDYWKHRKIPFIPPEFFYGNVREYVVAKTSLPELLDRYYQRFKKEGSEYGGCFQFKQPFLLLCSPEMVKDITTKSFGSFHDRSYPINSEDDPLSDNLFFTGGQKWKFLRAKLSVAFSSGKLKNMVPLMKEVADSYVEEIDKLSSTGEAADIREIAAKFTTDIIGSCAFGLQFNALQDSNSAFRQMGKKVFASRKFEELIRLFRDLYPWLATKIFKFRIFNEEVTDFFIKSVKETIQLRYEQNIQRNDLIQLLMQMANNKVTTLKNIDGDEFTDLGNYEVNIQEDAIELTDEVLAAQASVFFLAGFETSATTISFCLYEMAQNLDIQNKLAEESKTVLKKYGAITYEALQELTYMEQVLYETLRKYPPGSKTTRKCCNPYQIPGTDCVLETGTMVVIPIWSFHHDPQLFPEPDKFNPERFSSENKSKILSCTFMPFGAGPRTCIGMRFAMLEMKIALSSVIHKYRVLPCAKTRPIAIKPSSFVLAPIDGVWLQIEKRDGSI